MFKNLKLCQKKELTYKDMTRGGIEVMNDELRCHNTAVFSIDSIAKAFLGQEINTSLVMEGKFKFRFFSLKDMESSSDDKYGLSISLLSLDDVKLSTASSDGGYKVNIFYQERNVSPLIEDCSEHITYIKFAVDNQVHIRPFSGDNSTIRLFRTNQIKMPVFKAEVIS